MAIDNRGYYYRSRREGKRVVREYMGKGEAAGLMQMLDEFDRQKKELEILDRKREQSEDQKRDREFEKLDDLADQWARLLLQITGFHQHERGEWRKKREQ